MAKLLTIEQFIEKSRLAHGDFYDYSLVKYTNSRSKVKIFEGEAKEMCKLEKKLQNNNKQHKYTPNTVFSGFNECYIKLSKKYIYNG